jgi:hypothetical protein
MIRKTHDYVHSHTGMFPAVCPDQNATVDSSSMRWATASAVAHRIMKG